MILVPQCSFCYCHHILAADVIGVSMLLLPDMEAASEPTVCFVGISSAGPTFLVA
jgi:hypothetical protein